MVTNRTFTMLKPDAVEKGHIGAILEKISASGFRIVAMKLTQMTTADAEEFYAIHNERPFFGELVEYMTRGPIVAAVLEKDNAVEDFRTLIVLRTLQMLPKVPSVRCLQILLAKTLFTEVTVMRTQLLKRLSILLGEI